ncbi:MAG TPA: YSC84-related protein [Steroidobacteraceae bacterium]|jgi:lipid-binding SYLF domain-containing protein
MRVRTFSIRAAVVLLTCLLSAASFAGEREEGRLKTATAVLDELMRVPEQSIPSWLLEHAHAVAVVPAVIKVGLGIGGRRGKGVLVVRRDDGSWSNPIFINLTGGSVGFQLGVQSTDVVLVFTSRQSIEGIVGGKVTLGADASVAAGPVGRQSSAATDIGLDAQVYSYSRAKGLFAGVALDGSAITIDHRSNEAYYGRPGVLASEIIRSDAPTPGAAAREFIAAVARSVSTTATASAAPRASESTTAPSAPASQPAESQGFKTYPLEDPNPGAEPPE